MKYKKGDIVIPTEFESTEQLSFVEDMRLSVGKPLKIEKVDLYGQVYYLNGWAWPESALEPTNS